MAGAAVDDVLAWCLLALTAAIVTAGGAPGDMVQIGVLAAVYVAVMAVGVRPLLAYTTRRMVRDRVPPLYVVVVVAGLFLSSYATTWIGIHAIFGAFAFGFILPREPFTVLADGVRRPFEGISMVLLPVFFIVTGLNVDISAISGRGFVELAAIILVACVGLGVLDGQMFTMMVLMALFTTALAGPLLPNAPVTPDQPADRHRTPMGRAQAA